MSLPAVRFEQVSKRYYLGKRKAFIRELLPDFISKLMARRQDELWALRDLSFEVMPGEALGIIGSNGSGKTTSLSLLAGITVPTLGCVTAQGMIGALIQLGAGFHPELTGRENVYLNAAILGLKRTRVDEIYNEIVEFAELKPFMDTPIKRYSSGMFARLGFSVAAHIDPDVLLIDEVLSTGDMAFQAKCVARMRRFIDQGRAVIFVSHNLNMVQSLCHRVLWLDQGRCVQVGPSVDVIAAYSDEMDRRLVSRSLEEMREQNQGTGDIRVDRVLLRNKIGQEKVEFESGDSLTVELYYQTAKRIPRPYFWISICNANTSLFGANMLLDGFRPESVDGQGVLTCTFKSLPLLPQVYSVWGGIRAHDGATLLIQSRQFATFRVVGNANDAGLEGDVAQSMVRDSPPVLVPYEWRLS